MPYLSPLVSAVSAVASLVVFPTGAWQAQTINHTTAPSMIMTSPGDAACGNAICEDGERSWCPACVYSTPACMQPCRTGLCPKDCNADTKEAVCGNGVCEEGEKAGCQKDCGGSICIPPPCAMPPPNCTYVDPVTKDGCPVSCGTIKCDNTFTCHPPLCEPIPSHCKQVDVKSENGCPVDCGRVVCDDDDRSDCTPLSCKEPPPNCTYINPAMEDGCRRSCGTIICAPGGTGGDAGGGMQDTCADGHRIGETFRASDGCSICICTQKGVKCTESFCMRIKPAPVHCDLSTTTKDSDMDDCLNPNTFGPRTDQGSINMPPSLFPPGANHYPPLMMPPSGASDDGQFSSPAAGFEDSVRTKTVEDTNIFGDTDPESIDGKAANALAAQGVIGGFKNGTDKPSFKSGQPVNRAEAAKFLLLARYGNVPDQNPASFKDMLAGEWYVKYVSAAANLGIINGYGDGTFKPGQTVKTGEFLKMLGKTFGLPENLPESYTDVPADSWVFAYAGIAEKYDLFPGRDTELKPDTPLTRGDVAIAIYRLEQALVQE